MQKYLERSRKNMSLSEQLKERRYQEIWDQYCGFLDLSMEEYMKIQRRLMEEQIQQSAAE